MRRFEDYHARMAPVVRLLARQRTQPHPYLSESDLLQEALAALWEVWKRSHRLPLDDLCRVGMTAVVRRLIDQRRKATSRGNRPLRPDPSGCPCCGGEIFQRGCLQCKVAFTRDWRRLEDLPRSVGWMEQVTSAPFQMEETFLRLAVEEAHSMLSEVGRRLLDELLEPSERMLRVVHRLWTNRRRRRSRHNWPTVRLVALSRVFRIPVKKVDKELGEIRRAMGQVLELPHMSNVRYKKGEGRNLPKCNLKQEDIMAQNGKKGLIVDPKGTKAVEPAGPPPQAPPIPREEEPKPIGRQGKKATQKRSEAVAKKSAGKKEPKGKKKGKFPGRLIKKYFLEHTATPAEAAKALGTTEKRVEKNIAYTRKKLDAITVQLANGKIHFVRKDNKAKKENGKAKKPSKK